MKNEKLVPKRRFKEFQNAPAWEQRKLSDLLELLTDYDANGSFADMAKNVNTSDGDGYAWYVRMTDLKNESSLCEMKYVDEESYNFLKKTELHGGELLMTKRGEIGNVYLFKARTEFATLAPNMYLLKLNDKTIPEYLYTFFQNDIGKSQLLRLNASTTMGALYKDDVKNIKILLPNIEEQDKIAKCFSEIDHLITLHQRKLEKIKNIKSAYLSEMFPADGEAIPKRRFKGFTDAWEQRKFKDCFDYLQNNSLSRADLTDEIGDVLNVHYGDILVRFGEVIDMTIEKLPSIVNESILSKFQTSILKDGDIIIADAAEDETVGKCSEIKGLDNRKVLSGLHTIPVRPKEKYATGYLGYYMNARSYHDQLLPLMQGTKVSSISKSAIQNTTIMFPKSVEEQGQIGAYFQNLDNLITLHQRKLEKLQNMKKAYLEELFV